MLRTRIETLLHRELTKDKCNVASYLFLLLLLSFFVVVKMIAFHAVN